MTIKIGPRISEKKELKEVPGIDPEKLEIVPKMTNLMEPQAFISKKKTYATYEKDLRVLLSQG